MKLNSIAFLFAASLLTLPAMAQQQEPRDREPTEPRKHIEIIVDSVGPHDVLIPRGERMFERRIELGEFDGEFPEQMEVMEIEQIGNDVDMQRLIESRIVLRNSDLRERMQEVREKLGERIEELRRNRDLSESELETLTKALEAARGSLDSLGMSFHIGGNAWETFAFRGNDEIDNAHGFTIAMDSNVVMPCHRSMMTFIHSDKEGEMPMRIVVLGNDTIQVMGDNMPPHTPMAFKLDIDDSMVVPHVMMFGNDSSLVLKDQEGDRLIRITRHAGKDADGRVLTLGRTEIRLDAPDDIMINRALTPNCHSRVVSGGGDTTVRVHSRVMVIGGSGKGAKDISVQRKHGQGAVASAATAAGTNGAAMTMSAVPNPAANETAISFTLPTSGHTTLNIFDNTGKLVRTLLDEELSSGLHTVKLNTSDLPTGLYLYNLSSGNNSVTETLMITR